MNSETLLEVRGLYKSYSEVKVLNDVSLSVGKGSITGLIGENGAGKSTLIKCINGVTRPDSGEIIFQGRALKHITIGIRAASWDRDDSAGVQSCK